MYAVVNEQCACFTVLNSPNLNRDKEMQDGVVGVGWGRGYCKYNAEELVPKLLLMLKEILLNSLLTMLKVFPERHHLIVII